MVNPAPDGMAANPETSNPTESAAFIAVRLQPMVCSMETTSREKE